MATNYNLKVGYTITVTAGATKGSVHQIEDASVGAVLQPGFAKSFGPYLIERNFSVSDGATVSVAAYTTALGALLTSFAGAPVNAVAATANVNPTGDDNALTFTARVYGAAGNGISIRYVDPGGVTAALAVSVVGQAITVSLARAASAITSTAAEVKAAIEASAPANELVAVSILTSDSGSADDGTGIVTAMSQAALASGAGSLIGSVLPGALCIDTTNADVYRNDGTTAAPVWVKLGDAA